jgi:hypothetical protein
MWYKGERLKYAEVEKKRRHLNLAAQITMEIRQERLTNSYEAIDRLSEVFAAAKPDVTIIFGNDQAELFLDNLKPAFTIMGCPEFENMPRTDEQKSRLPPGIALADRRGWRDAGLGTRRSHHRLSRVVPDTRRNWQLCGLHVLEVSGIRGLGPLLQRRHCTRGHRAPHNDALQERPQAAKRNDQRNIDVRNAT